MAAYSSFNLDEGEANIINEDHDADLQDPDTFPTRALHSANKSALGTQVDNNEHEDQDTADPLEPPPPFSSLKRALSSSPSAAARKPKRTRPAHNPLSTLAAEKAAARTTRAAASSFFLHEAPSPAIDKGKRELGTFSNRVRPKGDRMAAKYKPVTPGQLDSDDELMLQMRKDGYTDAQIHTRLAQDPDRAQYDRKTISARVGRVRLAQAKHTDTLLEDGLKEWTYEEDLRLLQAYEYADMEIKTNIEREKAWRFKKTAEWMRKLDENADLLSEKVCRERFIGLINGTAKVPCDMTDDPAAARAALAAFAADRAKVRDEENRVKREKDSKTRLEKEKQELEKAAKAETAAKRRAANAAAKAAKAAQKAAKDNERVRKAAAERQAKEARLTQLQTPKKTQQEAADARVRAANTHAPLNPRAAGRVQDGGAGGDAADPRAQLSRGDLVLLCADRGMGIQGRESAGELVERLAKRDEACTLVQLRTMCKMKGLNIAGSKAQMKYQLAVAEAKKYLGVKEGEDGGDELGGAGYDGAVDGIGDEGVEDGEV